MAGRHFRQLYEQPGDPLTTSINFLCSWVNFHQLPSTFHAARGTAINFQQLYMQPRQLPSNVHAAGRPSVSFRQFSVRPVELPTELSCSKKSFRQLSLPSGDIPSTAGNIPFGRETLSQLASAFRATRRSSVKFHQLSVWPVDLSSISVNLPCCRETFCHLPSTFLCDR